MFVFQCKAGRRLSTGPLGSQLLSLLTTTSAGAGAGRAAAAPRRRENAVARIVIVGLDVGLDVIDILFVKKDECRNEASDKNE